MTDNRPHHLSGPDGAAAGAAARLQEVAAPGCGRLRRQMRLAAEFTGFAGEGRGLAAVADEACRVAAAGLRVRRARLLVCAPDAGFLVQAQVGWDVAGMAAMPRHDEAGTAAGDAWRDGLPVVCEIAGAARRVPGLPERERGGGCVAVVVPGEAGVGFGVLECVGARAFSALDVCFVQLLARAVGLVVRDGAQERQAARLEEERAAQGRERARVEADHRACLDELHHRVRNDLQAICSIADREAMGADREAMSADREAMGAAQGGLGRVARRVMALAGLYDHLLGPPASGVAAEAIAFDVYLGTLCARIAAAGELGSRGIALEVRSVPLSVPRGQALQLGVAVNELVANACEHAFPSQGGGRVTVRLASGAAGAVLSVEDDGRGFAGARDGSAGLGFVERLVRQAGASLAREEGAREEGAGTAWRIGLAG